jgi:hypothetical protein
VRERAQDRRWASAGFGPAWGGGQAKIEMEFKRKRRRFGLGFGPNRFYIFLKLLKFVSQRNFKHNLDNQFKFLFQTKHFKLSFVG